MRRLPWVLVLGLALARGSALPAQEPRIRVPAVNAGAVTTVVVQVLAPEGVDSAAYRLDLADGYRAFLPDEGTVGRLDDRFIFPITFATPDRLAAGRLVAGHLTVRVDGRDPVTRELAIRVEARREVEFVLDADEVTVAPDAVTGVPFAAFNRGNLEDTLFVDIRAADGWNLMSEGRMVLAPGDSIEGVLRIAAPVTASPGDRQLVLVTARTVAREQTRTLSMVVVSPTGWFGDLAQVPSSVFIGQSLADGSSPVVALRGAGSIGPDTRLQLDFRHSDGGIVDPALQRQMAGARLRAVLTRPGLEVDAGDVYGFESTLSGALRQALGVRTAADPDGPLSVRAIAAVPSGFGGETNGGHILHGEAGLETHYGEFQVLAGDMLQPARGGIVGTRSTGAGVRWTGQRGSHSGHLEATWVRFVADDSLQRTGPAVDLEYRLSSQVVSGRFRLRSVPDAATGPGGQGNELSGSLSAALTSSLSLVGWGHSTEQNLLGNGSYSETRAVNLGVRQRLGRLQLQLGGTLSDRLTTTAVDSFRYARNTVRMEAALSHGALSFASDAEVGESRELGADGAFRSIGGSVRWYGDGRWGWVRLEHIRRPGGVESTNIHTGGNLEIGPVAFSTGISTSLAGELTTTSFWSATEIQAMRNLTVHVGASARPTLDANDWSFSLGVSRRLNLPLPMARQPDLHGVVFDDANNNGVLDPGESPLSDVALSLGYLDTESDHGGRFAFRDASGARLRVRSGDLPLGYVLSPAAILPSRGEASIPLLRTATLHLDLFLDRDEDGERDLAESVGNGVVVTLTDDRGRRRTVTADTAGQARISGLLPGHYAVTAKPGDAGAAANPEVLMELDLQPGAEAHHTLAVPLRRRTIRMGGDTGGGFQFFQEQENTTDGRESAADPSPPRAGRPGLDYNDASV